MKSIQCAIIGVGNCASSFVQDLELYKERGYSMSKSALPDSGAVVAAFKASGANVLINFLPFGSQQAPEFCMECGLQAGLAKGKCIPGRRSGDVRRCGHMIEAAIGLGATKTQHLVDLTSSSIH